MNIYNENYPLYGVYNYIFLYFIIVTMHLDLGWVFVSCVVTLLVQFI